MVAEQAKSSCSASCAETLLMQTVPPCSLVATMRYRPFAHCLIVLSFFLSQAHAEKPFDFHSTPGKLPKEVVPSEYTVRIVPNVEARTFSGTVIIKVKASQPTRRLILNALDLGLTGAMVDESPLPP